MLHIWGSYEFSHHIIFKYIGFMSNHDISTINLNTIPFCSIFNEFNFVCSIKYITSLNRINLYFKKNDKRF